MRNCDLKYCPKCKLRMPEEEQACQKCGGPLRLIGGSEPAGGTGPDTPQEQLLLTLKGLEHKVQSSRKLSLLMGLLAAALTVVLLVVLIFMHFYHVLQFATIDRLQVLPASSPGTAEIKFVKLSDGKVEFVRESAGRKETLTEFFRSDEGSTDPEHKFVWGGNHADDYTIWVRYRSGWGLVQREWPSREGRL